MPTPTGPGDAPGGASGSGGTGDPRTQRSLFGPGDDNTVRGEVLVRLAAPATRSISTSIPTGPVSGLARGIPSRFGIPEVDAVLQKHGAVAVARLHPPTSDSVGDGG